MSDETKDMTKDQFVDYITKGVIERATSTIMDNRYGERDNLYSKIKDEIATTLADKFVKEHGMKLMAQIDLEEILKVTKVEIVKRLAGR